MKKVPWLWIAFHHWLFVPKVLKSPSTRVAQATLPSAPPWPAQLFLLSAHSCGSVPSGAPVTRRLARSWSQLWEGLSKKMTYGFKLHLLITKGGLITSATWLRELLQEHHNRIVIGDKAYVSAPVADELWQHNRIRLLQAAQTQIASDVASISSKQLTVRSHNSR